MCELVESLQGVALESVGRAKIIKGDEGASEGGETGHFSSSALATLPCLPLEVLCKIKFTLRLP